MATDTELPLDPQALEGLIPACYAEFRPLVADALAFFLDRLSPRRLEGILEAQAALPADAGIEERLVRLMRASPALHKVGQVVARDARLDPGLRRQLQRLESLEPHTPMDQLAPVLERELGPNRREYRIELAGESLAEASVAVVVPLTWKDASDASSAPPRQAVAKLLKPGIDRELAEDLDLLGKLADFLESRQEDYRLPPLGYREVFDEVADLLVHEVKCEQEQAQLRAAGQQLAGFPDVQVPAVLPFSTPAVTAMERVFGRRVTDAPADLPWRRPALFGSIVRALLSRVIFSRDESALFHGDPHAGNLFATDDGRLAMLDWSLSGRLTAHDRGSLAQVIVGALTLDGARVARAIDSLARRPIPECTLRRHVDAAMGRLFGQRLTLPGPSWAMDLLDGLAHAGVRFPPRLLLFRKAFFTLQGVLADVCPSCSLEAALMTEAVAALAQDWPLRWIKAPGDSDYATHVSSADLVQVAAAVPGALARWWGALWLPQMARR